MGRGAHAAHAAYNGSGTQGISVTDEINKNEEIHSVFITENDTTKQFLHGHNISEMTCAGKTEGITSERYKIFTPDENSDMLGDVYLNFEMDSEITDFTFVDTSPDGQDIDLQNVTQESLSKSFSFGGEDYNLMTVDYSNSSLPIPSSPEGENLPNVSYINKTLNVTYDNVNYEIVVGKGTTSNIAVKNLTSNSSWSNLNISGFSEIIDVIMINIDNKDLLIVGGRPANTSSPYKVVDLNNSGNELTVTENDLNVPVSNNYLDKDFNIIVKIFYENRRLIMSGFKYHDNEVLRSSNTYFHTFDAKYQTTFIIQNLQYNSGSKLLSGDIIEGVTFNPARKTASKRLESYNYKDCILSSSIKYDDTNYAYITGSKEKVLMALSPNQDNNNNKIKRSYDNGLNWEDVNFYQTPDNYYPLSTLYKKNETLVHEQLNIFGFLTNSLDTFKLEDVKIFIRDTFGYVKNDIKLINKISNIEYSDAVTIKNIIDAYPTSISTETIRKNNNRKEISLSDALNVRIEQTPIINDYEHIWVNINKSGSDSFREIWSIGKNIRMTSKKFIGSVESIEVINGGSGYTSAPTVTIGPPPSSAIATAILTDGVVTSIDVLSTGSGYDGSETVTITGDGTNASARINISETYNSRVYLTLGEFITNISKMLGLDRDQIILTVVYTLDKRVFRGSDTQDDNESVFDLGFLQSKKINVAPINNYSVPNETNLIRFAGKPQNSTNKPVDERLYDKFKIHLVVQNNSTTVIGLKNRLAEIYGGSYSDYLICKKNVIWENSSSVNTYTDNEVIYGSSNYIINSQQHSNNSILDTYTSHNMEIRFKETHPILSLSEPKIVYVSIPLNLGSGNIKRRTVSLLVDDLGNQFIESVTVDDGGSGYSGTETITIDPSDQSGTSATLTVAVTEGVITAVNVNTGGSGYNGTETITITPSNQSGISATFSVKFTPINYITLGALKNKIKTLLDPLYTTLNNDNYHFNLVKGGEYTGRGEDTSEDNFYGIVNGSPYNDSLNIDDETVGIKSGDILYFYFSHTFASYNYATTYMNNLINISLGTDPLYSEKIISSLGVMDDLKYYIPNVDILVNNDKGLWVAAGTPGDPDFIMKALEFPVGNLIEEALKRPNLVIFVSNNDGYDWHPVKFSVIEDSREGVLYKDANVLHYDDPKYKIEYVSGYTSNSRGDIRITFNIYDTSIIPPSSNLPDGFPGRLVTSGILDIDHYKICPDVISNYSLKAIKMKDIILDTTTSLQDCPLIYATSVKNEYDIYSFYADNPSIWGEGGASGPVSLVVQTFNSDIIYPYNEKIKFVGYTTQINDSSIVEIKPPQYKILGSYLITLSETNFSNRTKLVKILRLSSIDDAGEIIKINGEAEDLSDFSYDYYLETDSFNRAVLLRKTSTTTQIYTYDNENLNFRPVVALQFGPNSVISVKFLENVWIISGNQKLLMSYDTIHWREIQIGVTINEIFSKSNRYHESILDSPTIDDVGVMSFRPKILANNIDTYKGLSLFHDITIRGGIKINVDEELVADRTNYIIESYSTRFDRINGKTIFINNGILYEPNDIIKSGNQYIICGNNTGLIDGSKTLSLMESRYSGSELLSDNIDDIVFITSKSLYTHYGQVTNQKDFISNFNMERFYKDTNITSNHVYCSGSYTNNGVTYGILAIRSIPSPSERNIFQGFDYFWKLIYAPSLLDVPLENYEFRMDFENDNRAPWKDTVFEKINDLVFADNAAVMVGKGKNEVNLCYSEISYPELFGVRTPTSETHLKLNFHEIHTVCFYKGYWFVGGRPKYETNNDVPIKNNYCLAYTNNIRGGDWTYENFTLHNSDSSLYEVNNMEVIDINGNTSILTNISYVKKTNGVENLVMAILFIDIDPDGNLSFNNLVEFDTPGINEIEETGRTWNGFNLDGSGFDRGKWLNRPFDLEINEISRKIISTIHSPKTKDMYYVEYNSNKDFILIQYKDPYIPIIDKSDTGVYPKFIKHIKLGTETLTNKTRGHCYKIAKVTSENFITGLNSARYVAVGRGILSPISYSDDFENWTYSDAGNIFDIVFDVAHKHGLWIAIGEGNYNIGISKDGKSWTGIPKGENGNLIDAEYDSTLNSLSFSPDTKITDILPYVPNIKGIFLRNLSLLRLFSRIEYHVGTQIWQTLTFDDVKAMLDTEFGAGEYKNLLKNCSIINKNGSTRFTTWIPGFTKTLNSKLETFSNISESGSFPSGLLKDQKLSIKIYYNKLENVIGDTLESSDMNNAVFDNFMNNTLIPCDRNPNYFIDSFLADNYGFQLGDTYKNVNGKFRLKYKTEIQKFRLFSKRFELDDIEIDQFNRGVKQTPKITQGLYFDADNVGYLLLDLDSFNLYASHIIVSGWLTSGVHITDMNLELNGYSYQKVIEPSVIDYATKSYLGLNYNRYTFNGVDKEDGTGSLVIPLASTAYSGSSIPLDRYNSIRLRINFNTLAGPRSYINVTCVGTTTVSYNNSTANIEMY